jgi:hypothetical protein
LRSEVGARTLNFHLFLHLIASLAITALTALVVDDGFLQAFLIEVGPVGVTEIEF